MATYTGWGYPWKQQQGCVALLAAAAWRAIDLAGADCGFKVERRARDGGIARTRSDAQEDRDTRRPAVALKIPDHPERKIFHRHIVRGERFRNAAVLRAVASHEHAILE